MPQPTSPRAPKVADRRNHGVARGNEKRIPPNPCPRRGAVPVRRREERVWGDAAITQESSRPLGTPCPLSSPAAGRRHLPSPPPRGKSDASGSSLPAGTRRKRGATAGIRETAEQRRAPWAEGPGSEVLSRGREVPGGDRGFRGKAARDGEPPPPARGRHPWRDPRGLVLGWAGLGWSGRGLLAGRLQLPPGPSVLPGGNGSGDGASTFPRRQLQRYHSRR